MTVLALIGATAVIGSLAIAWWAVSSSDGPAVSIDLDGVRRRPAPNELHAARLERPAAARTIQPLVARAAAIGRRYTPQGRVTALEQRLLLAGASASWTIERVLAIKAVSAIGAILLAVLGLVAGAGAFKLLLIVGIGVLGYFGPDALLSIKTDDRQEVIRRALADTVDQLTVSVEAGLGLDAAIARVATTTEGPLASEFARVSQDVRAGMRRGDALLAMSDRVQLPELRQLVVALAQAEKLGVPVVQTMRVQAAELRVKRRQAAEEQAMKMPVKILFPMMVCILPCIFVIVLGPAAITMSQTLFKS